MKNSPLIFESIQELLDEYDIEYKTSGKNISQGWIGLQCPFCDDHSNHLGIKLKTYLFKCWRCGPKSASETLSAITGEDIGICKRMMLHLYGHTKSIPFYFPEKGTEKQRRVSEIIRGGAVAKLPPEATSRFPELHKNYLRSRNFPPLRTIRKYKLKAVHSVGKYMFRIIIPVIMFGRIVNYTARDVTGTQEPKYMNADSLDVALPRKQCIFNYDTISPGSDAIIVEGPMDAMRLGDGACCFFGVSYTPEQLLLMKKKKIRKLFIIFDSDQTGQRTARDLAVTLSPMVQYTEKILLTKIKDPGELTPEQARLLKEQLMFNK